jgi:hypothetical protein
MQNPAHRIPHAPQFRTSLARSMHSLVPGQQV